MWTRNSCLLREECENCESNTTIINQEDGEYYDITNQFETIKKQIYDKEFGSRWKKSTPQEKLDFYGITKLKLLAKNKGIETSHKKKTLLKLLSPIVTEKDFPIK